MEDDLYADLYGDTSTDAVPVASTVSAQESSKPAAPAAAPAAPPADKPASFIPPPVSASASTAGGAAANGNTSNSNSAQTGKQSNFNPIQSTGHVGANWAAHHSSTNAVQPSTFQSRMLSSSNFRDDRDSGSRSNGGGGAYSNGSGYAASSHGYEVGSGGYQNSNGSGGGRRQRDEKEEEGKMFVGGLNWDTTEDSLRTYMSQFGKVIQCSVMRDQATGRSRGFGFLTFEDPKAVNQVMVKEHFLDGKLIDPKRAIPRPEQVRSYKLFVGGISNSTSSESFRRFFEQFGEVVDVTLMMDKDTGRSRGYGFVTFSDEKPIANVMGQSELLLDGKSVDVRRAHQRDRDGNVQGNSGPQQGQQQSQHQARRSGGGAGGMGGGGVGGGGGGSGGSGLTYESGRTNNESWNVMGGGGGMGGMGAMNPMGMSMGMGGMNPMAAAMNSFGGMNPMGMGVGGGMGMGMGMGMGGGGAGGGFDPNAMAQLYQNFGWGGPNWNPQAAFQQMMASMGGGGGAAGGAINFGALGMGGTNAPIRLGNFGGGGGGDRSYNISNSNYRNNNHHNHNHNSNNFNNGNQDDGGMKRSLPDAATAGLPPRPGQVQAYASSSPGKADGKDGSPSAPALSERMASRGGDDASSARPGISRNGDSYRSSGSAGGAGDERRESRSDRYDRDRDNRGEREWGSYRDRERDRDSRDRERSPERRRDEDRRADRR
ncbi:hypothetical protein OC844_003497 [Tilletia horrida]|nr:hypothetical protein OC844_003497 [Tilletia horrida]